MGRLRPTADQLARRMWYRDYRHRYVDLPPLPANGVHWSDQAMPAIREMYGNGTDPGFPYAPLGNCTIAQAAHSFGVISGNANPPPVIFKPDAILKAYSACGGYVPGDPSTDNGCDEITVLNYLRNTGLEGPDGTVHKIAGYLALDATKPEEYEEALALFLNLIMCAGLPDGWVNPFPSADDFVWGVVGQPNPSQGHCFGASDYDPDGDVKIYEWAMRGNITQEAIATYMTEEAGGSLNVMITHDLLNVASQLAPSALNWSQLQTDFTML